MTGIDKALSEFRKIDELAGDDSYIHRLNPLAKILTTIVFILLVVSFDKYDIYGLVPMLLFPVFLFQVSGIKFVTFVRKLRYIIPIVCLVGIWNPFIDFTPLMQIGSITVSGGVISMITLMIKGVSCLMASFLLIATTPFERICAALRKIHLPRALVILLLLTYRYLTVLMEEVAAMSEAYHLRAPKQKGIHFSAWGSFLGQLLIRSMDRAEELYDSMKLRGFHGEFYETHTDRFTSRDASYIIVVCFVMVLFRVFNVAILLGNLVA